MMMNSHQYTNLQDFHMKKEKFLTKIVVMTITAHTRQREIQVNCPQTGMGMSKE